MPEINEKELFKILNDSKKILLLEPEYRRKYHPLGLMKISSYLKSYNKDVSFSRSFKNNNYDLICITTLFTYFSENVFDELQAIYKLSFSLFKNNNFKVLIGGIFASLMKNSILKKYPNIFLFPGYSKKLDRCRPDYSIDYKVDKKWDSFSYVFTSRGCPNKCAYCAVRIIEKESWINNKWKEAIDLDKPNVIIYDNNLSSCKEDHVNNVINFLVKNKKRVNFDNGFDCKYISKETIRLLSKLKFIHYGMRLAFDRINEDGIFQKAVEGLITGGIRKGNIMAYILFNFNDTPQDANYRATECVKLGIKPYPQQYLPLDILNRDEIFIGKYWSKELVKAFRFFWLMAGYYTKMSFENFIKIGPGKEKFILTKEDWDKWYYKK